MRELEHIDDDYTREVIRISMAEMVHIYKNYKEREKYIERETN